MAAQKSFSARAAHLTVTPYTFTTRSSSIPARFRDVTEEMRYYRDDLDVDALFTDRIAFRECGRSAFTRDRPARRTVSLWRGSRA
jgi:hypothetical protein